MNIIFDNSSKGWLLELFDKKVDESGFITEKDGTRIWTPEGYEIKLDDLAVVKKGSTKFIEQSKVDLIKRLIDFNHGDSVKILNFFKDILNNTDYNALRDSLFLREEYKRGNSIGYLKSEILSNYGQRGNIISNLCSAGYFEEVMMPLYNEDKTKFYEFYDLAVDRGVKALFVNHNMTVNEIKHRIKSAKNSGLKNINIHGIGSINVKNIKKSLEKLKKDSDYSFLDKNIVEGKNVIIVELIIS